VDIETGKSNCIELFGGIMNTLNLRTLMENNKEINYPIWHPFSGSTKNFFNQLVLNRGKGIYVYDNNGKEYIDACSGLWNVSLGYSNEKITDYIIKQLGLISYCSLFEHTNSMVVFAANKILGLLPDCFSKIQFTCSGSESIDLAIKVMREYWKLRGKISKNLIICFKKSYHGTYYGSMSVSGITRDETDRYAPFLENIVLQEVPDESMEQEEYEIYSVRLEKYIEENHQNIAGIIVEPILASAGVEIMPIEYLNRIYKCCKKFDVLITLDEVALGFYRTGKSFYFYNTDIIPDILCMAKGINSGYLPLGAVAFHKNIVDIYTKSNVILAHGSTQGGNVLACAATVGAIEEYERLNISENVIKEGKYLKSQLTEKLKYHKNISEIRGIGLLISIDLTDNKKQIPVSQIKLDYIQKLLAREGLLLYRSLTGLTLLPMLNITRAEIDKLLNILEKFFRNYMF